MRWLLTVRAVALVAIAASVAVPTGAMAQSQTGTEKAYGIALMCAGAAIVANDVDGAHRAMDAQRKLGAKLGYDNRRQSADLSTQSDVIDHHQRTDPQRYARYATTCKKLGMAT